jgi:hypothetical protein
LYRGCGFNLVHVGFDRGVFGGVRSGTHVNHDHSGQDADDGDDDQQLNQSETFLCLHKFIYLSYFFIYCFLNLNGYRPLKIAVDIMAYEEKLCNSFPLDRWYNYMAFSKKIPVDNFIPLNAARWQQFCRGQNYLTG